MGQCVQSTQGSTWQRWWTGAAAGLIFATGGRRSSLYLFQSNWQILFKITTKNNRSSWCNTQECFPENPATPKTSRLISNKQHAKWEGSEEVKLHRIHSSILTGSGRHSTSPGLGLLAVLVGWQSYYYWFYYYQLLSWNHELNYPNERGNPTFSPCNLSLSWTLYYSPANSWLSTWIICSPW